MLSLKSITQTETMNNKNIKVCLKNVQLIKKTILIPRESCDTIRIMSGTIYIERRACWFQIVQKESTQYEMKFKGDMAYINAKSVDILYNISNKEYIMFRNDEPSSLFGSLFWMLKLDPDDAKSFQELSQKQNPKSLLCMILMYSKHDMTCSDVEELSNFLKTS